MGVLSVFISFRTSDTGPLAATIAAWLKAGLGLEQVFHSPSDIELLDDWPATLDQHIEDATVTVALVGDRWANCADPCIKKYCIHDPADWVFLEVTRSLDAVDTAVLPVLVDVARLPGDDLPEEVMRLGRIQGIRIDGEPTDEDLHAVLAGCWLGFQQVDERTVVLVSDDTDEAEVAIDELVEQLRQAGLVAATELSATVNDPRGLRAVQLRQARRKWPSVIAVMPTKPSAVALARMAAVARLRGVKEVALVGAGALLAGSGTLDVLGDGVRHVIHDGSESLLSASRGGWWSSASIPAKAGISAAGILGAGAVAVALTGGPAFQEPFALAAAADGHIAVTFDNGDPLVTAALEPDATPIVGPPTWPRAVGETDGRLVVIDDDLSVQVGPIGGDLNEVPVPAAVANVEGDIDVSADGATVAISVDGHVDLYDTASGASRRLDVGTDSVWDPQFSPDGSQVLIHAKDIGATATRLVTAAVATGEVRTLTEQVDLDIAGSVTWSPDSQRVAFIVPGADAVSVVDVPTGIETIWPIGRLVRAHSPSWSPDGTRIVYSTNDAGPWYPCVLTVADGSIDCLDGLPNLARTRWSWADDLLVGESISCGFDECRDEDVGVWAVDPYDGTAFQVLRVRPGDY